MLDCSNEIELPNKIQFITVNLIVTVIKVSKRKVIFKNV